MLEAITVKLNEFLQVIMVDNLKAKQNEGIAIAVGATSVAVAAGSAVAAIVYPPAGAVMAVGYAGSFLVSYYTAVTSYNTKTGFVELTKQLTELQDKTYKYKDQVAAGKTKINKILMKQDRMERPLNNRG